MPQRNTELLQQVMQHITDFPEQHHQPLWINVTDCGTAACFAGRAALLSGWSVHDLANARDMFGEGARLLGLTLDETDILFNPNNTRPTLELMVKDLVNGDELREFDDYERAAG